MTDTQPAPTVPDEAVEAAAEVMSSSGYRTLLTNADYWTEQSRAALAAAAPFIVAANQPDAAEQPAGDEMHGSSVQPDLDAIRARVENADDGPWQYQRLPWGRTVIAGGYDFTLDIADHLRSERDAEFIAHAREDVPALLAEVGRLRAQRDAALAAASTYLDIEHYRCGELDCARCPAEEITRALAGDATP